MLFIDKLDDALPFCKALGSELRIRILKLLTVENDINLNELASRLGITNGALTAHIRVLEECGLIKITSRQAKHGVQKICSIIPERYLINIGANYVWQRSYDTELAPGQYVDYEASAPCGLATREKIIGVYDSPQYFTDPEHFSALVIWLTTGYIEYEIPNFIPDGHKPVEILLHAELGSEAPAYNSNWESDIHVSLCGKHVGIWRSPGDFGGVKGIYNPDWWVPSMNQYGTLFEMAINKTGCYFDQSKVSDITIDDFALTPSTKLRFRLSVPEGFETSRGLTIFGRGFGNFDNGIVARVSYEPKFDLNN